MKLVRTIGMHTDHSYHGTPIETSRVSLYLDESLMGDAEVVAIAKRNQEMKLKSMAKRMPHSFWNDVHKE